MGNDMTFLSVLHNSRSFVPSCSHFNRFKHTVRVIMTEDIPDVHAYTGEVHIVKAGYARNFLIPLKKAVYAIPKNFKQRGLIDIIVSTPKETYNEEETADIRAADFLRFYLQTKRLKLWRNVDTSFVDATKNDVGMPIHPGIVTADHVKEKLKKQ